MFEDSFVPTASSRNVFGVNTPVFCVINLPVENFGLC